MHTQKSKPEQRTKKGKEAEDIACVWLESKGYTILEQNYRAPRGEIDIIAKDLNNTLVFIEVRSLTHSSPRQAIATIGPTKRKRFTKAVQHYLAYRCIEKDPPIRFDFVGINFLSDGTIECDLLEGGFALNEGLPY